VEQGYNWPTTGKPVTHRFQKNGRFISALFENLCAHPGICAKVSMTVGQLALKSVLRCSASRPQHRETHGECIGFKYVALFALQIYLESWLLILRCLSQDLQIDVVPLVHALNRNVRPLVVMRAK